MADDRCMQMIQRNFSLYGLVLSRELKTSLAKRLSTIGENERETWLNRIIELILTQNLNDPHVGVQHVKIAIEECFEPNKLKDTETVFNVIGGYDVPKMKFDISKNKFIIDDSSLSVEAEYKSLIFKRRFDTVWHKTLRHKQFQCLRFEKRDGSTGGIDEIDKNPPIPIEYLLSEQRTGKVRAMGMITQFKEDEYYLEDTSGTVRIDLSNTDFQDTLVMEGCTVMVDAVYKDDVLHVEKMHLPPIESSESLRSDFGDANTFGGPSNVSLRMSEKLQVHQEMNQDGMIVFIAELWLDVPNVLQKFHTLLEGYVDYPPIAFVLCGHFLSCPTNASSAQVLTVGFDNLTAIIARYSNLRESSKFVFVPGPHDLGSPKIFPKPPLPKCIVRRVTETLPSAIFTTNPCRIQYCTKEIVVLREDMLTKMCRNALHLPKHRHFEHFGKTIISQSHLSPVPLQVVPVYWKHDHALEIYPTPDLIVIADSFETYTTSCCDCYVINPGLFSKNNFSFQAYVPAINQIEDCQLPNDTSIA